jgi:pimeloyl-ACP methyl ester carboxylesterase
MMAGIAFSYLRFSTPEQASGDSRRRQLAIAESNERRERPSMSVGQIAPYLEMLRANIPTIRIEVIPGTGHFPQIDKTARVNTLLEDFIVSLPAVK